jgi:hypothetical protein
MRTSKDDGMWMRLWPLGVALVPIVMLVGGLWPGARHRFSAKWIREQRAPITEELAAEVENVRWRQRTGALLGALLGLAVALPVAVAFDPADDEGLILGLAVWIVPIMLTGVGRCTSGAIGAIREVRGPVRVAHPSAARLSDFVTRTGLAAVRIEVLGIVAIAVLAIRRLPWNGFGFGPGGSGFVWAAVGLVTLSWVVAEMVAGQLVARPQPSADAAALFWRETLRGERLRDVYLLPASLGPVVSLIISDSLPRPSGSAEEDTFGAVVMVAMIVVPLVSVAAQSLVGRPPSSRRRTAALLAARQSYERL